MEKIIKPTVILLVLLFGATLGNSKSKWIPFADFSPQTSEEVAIFGVIRDFQKSTNEEDKDLHFSLFEEKSVMVIRGSHFQKVMKGKKEIIAGTPWTGTKIEFTEIMIGRVKGTKAKAKTKVSVKSPSKGAQLCTYKWEFIFLGEAGWKIKELTMLI
jgi:hypothetical protein